MKTYPISIRISLEPHILKSDIGAVVIDIFPKDLSKQKQKKGRKWGKARKVGREKVKKQARRGDKAFEI